MLAITLAGSSCQAPGGDLVTTVTLRGTAAPPGTTSARGRWVATRCVPMLSCEMAGLMSSNFWKMKTHEADLEVEVDEATGQLRVAAPRRLRTVGRYELDQAWVTVDGVRVSISTRLLGVGPPRLTPHAPERVHYTLHTSTSGTLPMLAPDVGAVDVTIDRTPSRPDWVVPLDNRIFPRASRCADGDPESCYRVAAFFEDLGIGRPDEARARRLYAAVCDGPDGPHAGLACRHLGSTTSDVGEATTRLERACSLGFLDVCKRLGRTDVGPPPAPQTVCPTLFHPPSPRGGTRAVPVATHLAALSGEELLARLLPLVEPERHREPKSMDGTGTAWASLLVAGQRQYFTLRVDDMGTACTLQPGTGAVMQQLGTPLPVAGGRVASVDEQGWSLWLADRCCLQASRGDPEPLQELLTSLDARSLDALEELCAEREVRAEPEAP